MQDLRESSNDDDYNNGKDLKKLADSLYDNRKDLKYEHDIEKIKAFVQEVKKLFLFPFSLMKVLVFVLSLWEDILLIDENVCITNDFSVYINKDTLYLSY